MQSGANFWVPFKMDPKFYDFEKFVFSLFAPNYFKLSNVNV